MDTAAKQQIVERIKQANNILVTVSNNPSVDQLAACIGLTLLLNKMGKHGTAVFSGKVPSTLEFLQPEKTIETNTNSLRDFIISLDKSKADKLRYKIEDQFVKVFITPYRTSLTEKDLVFSEGDFNVEVVLALGVKDKNQLDQAITAHGRILHDATVVSVNAGNDKVPDIGQLNWQEPTASSLSEMLVSISEAFGPNLIDNQIATAFLTGIVAETERFSNPKTSPKVMTMSAQLMAAGANQQLIVTKLEAALPPPPPPPPPPPKETQPKEVKKEEEKPAGDLKVTHMPDAPQQPEINVPPNEIRIDNEGNLHAPGETSAKSATPPSGHALLTPLSGGPVLETSFTANTQPSWQDSENTVPMDPLSQNASEHGGIYGHVADVQPLSAAPAPAAAPAQIDPDQARKNVESALQAAPFTPDNNPVQSLNAVPVAEVPHLPVPETVPPPAPEPAPDKAAPPPVPPPIPMPTPGAMIPPPFNPADKNLDNTL